MGLAGGAWRVYGNAGGDTVVKLTYDRVVEIWQGLNNPEIPYQTSEHIPKINDEGQEMVIKFPTEEGNVLLFHPDLLPVLETRLGAMGYRLIQFDWEGYARNELERQLTIPRLRIQIERNLQQDFRESIRKIIYRYASG